MKYTILFSLLYVLSSSLHAQVIVEEVGTLTESVANSAVAEGFIDDVPYLYTFGGIDSTKIYSGIHLRSYRYNTETGESIRIPDLPDTRGKIGVGASRVGNIIYIFGGYYVFPNGSEETSNKVHRYDIENNVFLTDGADIPVATDDHTQVVWRDSLIILVTGWRNNTNITDVQIYDPAFDTWQAATSVPNLDPYRSFGSSGTIVNDTIFYFGGASSSSGFNIQNHLRKGVINPQDPTQIQWSLSIPDGTINGYRMASTTVGETPYWIGGSNITYNFDGIAYNGSGGVPPADRVLNLDESNEAWEITQTDGIPMDLRGIACVGDSIKYIAGGMLADQEVTNKVYRLEWRNQSVSTTEAIINENLFSVSPNPCYDSIQVNLRFTNSQPYLYHIYDSNGDLVNEGRLYENNQKLSLENFVDGIYYLSVYNDKYTLTQKLIKTSK